MCAVLAKDGSRHHSASRASMHDERSLGAKSSEGPKPEGEGGEEHMHAHSHKGGEDDVSGMQIHDVVQQHGPATHIFTDHDHEANKHHVHSVHGEKHHHSDHSSHTEAHQHMGHALGIGGESDHEEYERPETESAEESRAGGGIPGL